MAINLATYKGRWPMLFHPRSEGRMALNCLWDEVPTVVTSMLLAAEANGVELTIELTVRDSGRPTVHARIKEVTA